MDNEKVVEQETEVPAPAAVEEPAPAPVEKAAEETVEAPAAPAEDKPAKAPFRQNNNANRKRKKVCHFCEDKVKFIDYKDPKLAKYTSERGKILPRRVTGTCTMHQRHLTTAIKRARQMALLPYVKD